MIKNLIVIIFIILSILLNRYVSGGELECVKCHQKLYDEITKAVYKHPDFVQRDCAGCHISKRKSISDVSYNERIKAMRINLMNYDQEHIVILSNMSNDSTYQVKIKVKDMDNKNNESETLTFIPASIPEFIIDDKTPPQISNIKVNRIDVSVFANAEITWETDEMSDSRVEYWQIEDYKYSSYSDNYTRKHSIILNNLKHKNKYRFRVISSDSFGNKIASGYYTFDTSKSFNNRMTADAKKYDNKKPDFNIIKIMRFNKKEMDSTKGSVFIYFTTSSAVVSTIEYFENREEDYTKGLISAEEAHGRGMLKNRKEVGIDTCVELCHRQGASHPVGVSARGNIRIPDNLPTADGRVITCTTCHLPHGSKERYFARMDFKRDICILCHIDRL